MHAALQTPLLSIVAMLAAVVSAESLHEKLEAEEIALMGVSAQQRMEALSDTYLASIDTASLSGECQSIRRDSAEDIFDATALVAIYRRDDEWVDRTVCVYRALNRSGLAARRHHRLLHGLLVSVHRFGDANDLQRRYAIDVPILPTLPDSNGAKLGVIKMTGVDEFQALSLPINGPTGVQVVAIVHPYCGFSTRALDALLNDPEHAWLRPHLQLVVARESVWPEAAIREWSTQHPEYPMHVQDMGSGWASLETLETPIFHLLRDGELIISTKGWSGDGKALEPLRRELQRSD